MRDIGITLRYNKELMWQSDWNGFEVGFDEIEVVGLYQLKDTELYFYIDYVKSKIVDAWIGEEL
jgi:hypothetical protein